MDLLFFGGKIHRVDILIDMEIRVCGHVHGLLMENLRNAQ